MATPDQRAAARKILQRAIEAARTATLRHLPPQLRALLGRASGKAGRVLLRHQR